MPDITFLKSSSALLKHMRSEAMLLALVPFCGSFIALAFEFGYVSFFDVPIRLIELDFVKIISASVIVIFYFGLYALFAAITVSLVRGENLFIQAMAGPAAALLIFVPLLALSPSDPAKWQMLFILCVVLALAQLLPPIFQRSAPTYKERLRKQLTDEKADEAIEEDSLLERYIVQPMVFALFLLGIVYLIGRQQAEEQTSFWVSSDDPDWIFVANYGDSYVFKKLDREKNEIGIELRVTKIDDSTPINLNREVLKPLKGFQ